VIDTHAHLEMCDAEPGEVVEQAAAAGVTRILTIGREQAVALAERFDGVWAIAGWHPHEASEAEGRVGELRPLLEHPRVVALGECGLDFHYDNAPRDIQRQVFIEQIELANETGKPLVIHTRDADEVSFPLLREARVPVVLHCFSSVSRLDEALERGYACSFAGNVTFPRAAELREAVRQVPDHLLLAETDSPYLAPVPRRGRPNRPANVVHTLNCLAEVRGVEPDVLERLIELNARRLFGLP
jgi:TatD DNase family protein